MTYIDPITALNNQQREQRLAGIQNAKKEKDNDGHGKGGDALSRRDYFAAAAIQGLVSTQTNFSVDIVSAAVSLADALIAKLDEVKK
jgi:hypothetical protein